MKKVCSHCITSHHFLIILIIIIIKKVRIIKAEIHNVPALFDEIQNAQH